MDEELELRDSTEGRMMAEDEAATFEPFEVPTEGDVEDMSDDDIAAALGYATTVSEPMLPQDEMTTGEDEAMETADESPETAEEAVEEPTEVSSNQPSETEQKILDRLDELEEQIKSGQGQEERNEIIEGIQEELDELKNDENGQKDS